MNPELFRYCSTGSALIIALLAWGVRSRVQTPAWKYMLWYLYFRGVFELISFVTSEWNMNNMVLFYIYCILETLLIVFILTRPYYMKAYANYIWTTTVLLVTGTLFESFYLYPSGINTYSRLAECLLLFTLFAITGFQIARSPHRKALYKLPEYWFSFAFMFYFGIHSWVALTSNYSLKIFENQGAIEVWMFNSIANIVTNLIILCCLYLLYRKPT